MLLTSWWLLSIFKSTRFHSHSLLCRAIADITILQHCFLYFLMLSNCSCTFVSFVYLFCRTWVILREFFMLPAKLCPRVDIKDLFHIWNCLSFFHLKEHSLLLWQHLLQTKLPRIFLHPLKEKKKVMYFLLFCHPEFLYCQVIILKEKNDWETKKKVLNRKI